MRCPACRQADLEVFFEQPRVPVLCNVLWPSAIEARRAPTGEIALGACGRCGMIANTAFDPGRMHYDQAYENSLHFSPRFRAFAEELATGLIRRHGLRGRTVVDIGCGKGDFLRLLCSLGPNRGIGFDTSWEGGDSDEPAGAGSFRVVRAFYDESHGTLAADLVCCRHVLEHIPDPLPFLATVRRAAAGNPRAAIFFEVPNALYTLRDLGIWDVIYEHCSYYSPVSLPALFRAAGFGEPRAWTAFGEQYLCLEATLDGGGPDPDGAPEGLADLLELCRGFGRHQVEKVGYWSRRLAAWRDAGTPVAIWGAGSKGVTFLNTVEGGAAVACAVDINTRKHGRHVPGTAQRVVGPGELRELGVRAVLIMNPLYRDEIAAALREAGVEAVVEVV